MNNHRTTRQVPPSWENLPTFSDENIWDVVELLHALIDTCEDHYAEPLRRWRELRYLELCQLRENDSQDQYDLPLDEFDDEPFRVNRGWALERTSCSVHQIA